TWRAGRTETWRRSWACRKEPCRAASARRAVCWRSAWRGRGCRSPSRASPRFFPRAWLPRGSLLAWHPQLLGSRPVKERQPRPQGKTNLTPGEEFQGKKAAADYQEALDAYKKARELFPDKYPDPDSTLDAYKKALKLKRGEKGKVPEEIERLEKLKALDRLRG